MNPKLVSAKDVARNLGVSVDTVRRLKRDNLIPYVKIPGKTHPKFIMEDVVASIRKNCGSTQQH